MLCVSIVKNELEEMFLGSEQLVYVGKDSLSPFAQMTTTLLMAALTGCKISVILDPQIGLENYDGSTYRSHTAKALLPEEVYQEMRFLRLIQEFEARGVAPELSNQVRAITDSIQGVVDSYMSSYTTSSFISLS